MNPFEELIDRFENLKQSTVEILIESISERKEEISDLVIAQLQKGEDGDGNLLPDYSPTSVSVYGKPAGPIKLFDEGDYYEGHDVVVEDDGFKVINTDSKTQELTFRFGDEIVKMQDASLGQMSDDFLSDDIGENIEKRLGI